MALDKITNVGLSDLASGIDSSQTTLTVLAGTGGRFPLDSFNLIIWNRTDFANPIDAADREIVRCTSRTGDVLTIIRGQEGTTGSAHNTAGKTYAIVTPYSQKFRDDLHALIIQNVSTQVFTANGTYTKPANLIAARVIVVGPGGGSGGVVTGGASGGGGSGGYSESFLLASAIGATESVTVPAGGAAGSSAPGAGGNGSAASFGTLVVANGGLGSAAQSATNGAGANGAASGTGQVALAGSDGDAAPATGVSGPGGPSALGGKARNILGNATGLAGKANTGGGASGSSESTGTGRAGAAGGSGIVIVQEFRAG